MSYRNKTYIIFNADYPNGEGDIKYYRLMTAWKKNKKMSLFQNSSQFLFGYSLLT